MIFVFNYRFLPDGKLITTSESNADFCIKMEYTSNDLSISLPDKMDDESNIETFITKYVIPIIKKLWGHYVQVKKIDDFKFYITSNCDYYYFSTDDLFYNFLNDIECTAVDKYNESWKIELDPKLSSKSIKKSNCRRRKETSTKKIISTKKVSSQFFDNFEFVRENDTTVVKRSNLDTNGSIIHINFPIPSEVRDEWKKFFDQYDLKWGKGIAIAIEYLIEQTEKGNVIFK